MSETGYIYAVVCAVAQSMSMIVVGACLERLLTGKDDRVSKRKRRVIWLIGSCVLPAIKCLSPVPAVYITFGTQTVMSLWFAIFVICCYRDKGRIKLLHVAMLLLQNVLADIVQDVAGGRPKNFVMWEELFKHRTMAEICIMVTVISCVLNIAYTIIVLRRRKKKHIKTSPVWLALMLLIILIFTEIEVIWTVPGLRISDDWYFAYRCIFAVLEFAILMLYLSQSEKREAQEEKREAQEEVSKLQQVMELEKVHYEQIEARREEMAKIRHDYNNVITSVMFMIENGRIDEAGNVIKDLSKRISNTREYPFCGVPIINAILTEKQRECEAEGISLTVDLLLPDTSTVADLDLCMIFGNLMDNAIRSCRELRAVGKECSITLNGGSVQEYLIVKCRNTSLENREKKIKGTGYGHKILSDLAGKYDGDFQTAYENGIFTAQISLKNSIEIEHRN